MALRYRPTPLADLSKLNTHIECWLTVFSLTKFCTSIILPRLSLIALPKDPTHLSHNNGTLRYTIRYGSHLQRRGCVRLNSPFPGNLRLY